MKTTMKIMLVLVMGVISLSGMGRTMAQGKSIEIDEGAFPDFDFQMYVEYAFDKNRDGKLSDAERKAVKEIDIGEDSDYKLELEYNSVLILKGIEYFPNLKKLDCSDNAIKKLDVSKLKNLEELRCAHNNIKVLDLRKNTKLKYVDCEGNKIKTLDISANKNLLEFYCEENKLKNLDVSQNKKLKVLSISGTKIKQINLNKLKKLEQFYCARTKIEKIDLKNNKKLNTLDCLDNAIKKLDVKHLRKLGYLRCSNNKLKKLDLRKNKLLTELYCDGNSLISGNLHVSYKQLEDCEYSSQKRTIKVKKIGKYYYVPINNFNKTNVVTKLSAGKITDKGIQLKGKKIPKKITYEYNMFNDGEQKTKVTITVKK